MTRWGEIKCARCEELDEQIAAMEEGLTAVHMAGYMDGRKAAEAKLTQALRALERIEMSTDTREQGAIAMATLAELKGQGE